MVTQLGVSQLLIRYSYLYPFQGSKQHLFILHFLSTDLNVSHIQMDYPLGKLKSQINLSDLANIHLANPNLSVLLQNLLVCVNLARRLLGQVQFFYFGDGINCNRTHNLKAQFGFPHYLAQWNWSTLTSDNNLFRLAKIQFGLHIS